MASATSQPADENRTRLGGRAIALLLVLAIHVLLVVMLLMLAPPRPSLTERKPSVFVLVPVPTPKAPRAPVAKAKRTVSGAPRSAGKPAPAATKAPEKPGSQPFGTELFDAVDIAKLPNHSGDKQAGETADGNGAGSGSGSAYGPGGGPGGERLYPAEWYSEATHAELAYYLPKNVPVDSWAMIACRTIEKYRVDDCRELSESPPGSGLSRALRQAEWQFRVLPPLIGGHAEVGAWVSIRIDFTEDGVKQAPG